VGEMRAAGDGSRGRAGRGSYDQQWWNPQARAWPAEVATAGKACTASDGSCWQSPLNLRRQKRGGRWVGKSSCLPGSRLDGDSGCQLWVDLDSRA